MNIFFILKDYTEIIFYYYNKHTNLFKKKLFLLSMKRAVSEVAQDFLENIGDKPLRIISHYDTDGITSAAILIKVLQRMEKKFTVRIVKGLDKEIINEELARDKGEVIIISDLGSGVLDHLQNLKEKIYILDHHEVDSSKLNDKIMMVNPHLTESFEENDCTGAGVCYLFAKEIDEANKDLSKLAIIGMIGDRHESNLSKINQQIVQDCDDLETKRGLTLYPSTRPLRRSLEYSTSPYIPGVTGNGNGVIDLLRETGIGFEKALLDINQDEMSKLVTAIMVRRAANNHTEDIIGNIFVLKFFNTKEDAREISTMINACSRLGYSDIAISYCLEYVSAKSQVLDVYNRYKQELVSGLKVAEGLEKIRGKNFVILNAQDKIKDAIIGTICSMLSSSPNYKEGTILIGMAYNEDKIKVSARIAGREGRNLKELMERTVVEFKADNPNSCAEVGGHHFAAGCVVEKEKEDYFIEKLKKNLEIEVIRM